MKRLLGGARGVCRGRGEGALPNWAGRWRSTIISAKNSQKCQICAQIERSHIGKVGRKRGEVENTCKSREEGREGGGSSDTINRE